MSAAPQADELLLSISHHCALAQVQLTEYLAAHVNEYVINNGENWLTGEFDLRVHHRQVPLFSPEIVAVGTVVVCPRLANTGVTSGFMVVVVSRVPDGLVDSMVLAIDGEGDPYYELADVSSFQPLLDRLALTLTGDPDAN